MGISGMSTLESLAGEGGLCVPEWDAPKWWPGGAQLMGEAPLRHSSASVHQHRVEMSFKKTFRYLLLQRSLSTPTQQFANSHDEA